MKRPFFLLFLLVVAGCNNPGATFEMGEGSDPTTLSGKAMDWLTGGDTGEVNRWIFAPLVFAAGAATLTGVALLFFDRKMAIRYVGLGVGLAMLTALAISLLKILWLAALVGIILAAIGLIVAWKSGRLFHWHVRDGKRHLHMGGHDGCSNGSPSTLTPDGPVPSALPSSGAPLPSADGGGTAENPSD